MTEFKPGVAQLAETLAGAAPLQSVRSLPLPSRDAVLHFGPWRELPDTIRYGFSIGGQAAVLDVPQATMDWILQPLGASRQTDGAKQGMLLELACLDLLTAIEDKMGTVQPEEYEQPAVSFDVAIGALHLSLHLSPPLADALDGLMQMPDQPDPSGTTVPVRLRLGRQFLTDAEIAMLAVGDVIMLEPGPARLLAGDGFAAAVALTDSGPVAQSVLLPLPAAHSEPAVDFDIGGSEMSLAELNALEPGVALTLACFADTACDLVTGGRVLGRGAQVMIGSGAGIRILHLFDAKAR